MDWGMLWTVFFGAMCGYVASRILGGEGHGFLGNIVVGIIGGFVGTYLFKFLKVDLMSGFVGNLVSAVSGAIVFLLFLEMIQRISPQRTTRRRQR